MPVSLDSSYALELQPRFRRRLRARKRTELSPSQVKALSKLIVMCSHFEKNLLYGTLCEGYDRGQLRILAQFSTPKRFEAALETSLQHDLKVIDRIYSRKLSNNIVGYQSLHYYENYLRGAVSNYLSETITQNWHHFLLHFLARDFELFPDPDTDEIRVELRGFRELKDMLEPLLLDSAVLEKDTFDRVFTLLRKYFAKLASTCEVEADIHAKIAESNSRQFLAELSINEIQSWIFKDWATFLERSEFRRAKESRIHRMQLRSYFDVIAGYRNATYHHSSDGGAPAAVKRIKRIVDIPEEYTRFLGPDVPIIASAQVAREVADELFDKMPADLRKGTSVAALRYFAKRYSASVLKEGFKSPQGDPKEKRPSTVYEMEQFRPPGIRSLYARNLEAYVRSQPDLTWVWWPTDANRSSAKPINRF